MKVYVLLASIAMALTILLTPMVRWTCLRFGIVPPLRGCDLQKTPIPRVGGHGRSGGDVRPGHH